MSQKLRPCGHCMAKYRSVCCDKAKEFDLRLTEQRKDNSLLKEELNSVLSILKTERDSFGKKEIDLINKLNLLRSERKK